MDEFTEGNRLSKSWTYEEHGDLIADFQDHVDKQEWEEVEKIIVASRHGA
jgi:hypothetical protein